VPHTSLQALQSEYRDLLDSLPPSPADEIVPLLERYARGLGLKREHGTATQGRFVAEQMRSWLHTGAIRWRDGAGAADWLARPCRAPGSMLRCYSTACVVYVVSHQELGIGWPTFTEELQAALARPTIQQRLVNVEGALTLAPMIRAHGVWLARLLARREAARDRVDAEGDGTRWDDARPSRVWEVAEGDGSGAGARVLARTRAGYQ
jgi:hypothetical protein